MCDGPFVSHLSGIVRASSLFPILSTVLLMLGGVCVGVGRVYSGRNNILLSAGILFVAAGTSSKSPPSYCSSERVRDSDVHQLG